MPSSPRAPLPRHSRAFPPRRSSDLVLVAFRRFRHLAAYVVIVPAAALLFSAVMQEIGRMRPAGIQILGPWQGYAQPSRPVALLTLARSEERRVGETEQTRRCAEARR